MLNFGASKPPLDPHLIKEQMLTLSLYTHAMTNKTFYDCTQAIVTTSQISQKFNNRKIQECQEVECVILM